jgi:translation initiation factor IF-3
LERARFGKTDGDKRRAGQAAVEPRVNDQIRAAEIRLVGPDGEQIGIVGLAHALQVAAEVDLDLVEVAPTAQPPVCKLVDYGKYKYEAGVKAREARRNQQQTTIKAMNFRPKIDPHDFETKKGHVLRFLRGGNKVKVTIWFRGRERFKPELGLRILTRLAEDIGEDAVVESEPRQDGRNMVMVLAPVKARPA